MRTKLDKNSGFSYVGAIIFFVVIALVIQTALVVYEYIRERTDDLGLVALLMLGIIIILSGLCTVADVIRRKIMVDRPVAKILTITEKIACGDFSARVDIEHTYDKYDEFDLIAEDLNYMAEALSKSEMLKSDFISNVSHELKTPLAVIESYTKKLLDNELDGGLRIKHIETICSATAKLSKLVSNILLLNKLENQHLRPEIKKVDLCAVLSDSVLAFESLIEERDLTLECDIDTLYISSSPDYLEIVFNNLISNAIKFTEPGGQIAIKLYAFGDGAAVEISDTGCGIPEEVGMQIFDKFYQGDTSHSSEGNGLGLAMVKKVIDILGGEIKVESETGVGSKFTIILRG
ncbi:MAG: sensor histidine kinase [Clostridia bacterium]|nr:sensor histidine kinase [Clostridia bacterium]